MADVVIGMGANVGDPAGNLREAVRRLHNVMEIRSVSSLYRTEPVGLRDQPFFLNAVLAGTTRLEPLGLIALFGTIEAASGRTRPLPMGPRTLDLDLLLYDDLVLDDPACSVPHPRMLGRRFVMAPLAEIAPNLVLPGCGLTPIQVLAELPWTETVELLADEDWPPILSN
jgi:2-amino-4-hydroxy-6-hydroxymethyldihydropteridine diphosphokinase